MTRYKLADARHISFSIVNGCHNATASRVLNFSSKAAIFISFVQSALLGALSAITWEFTADDTPPCLPLGERLQRDGASLR